MCGLRFLTLLLKLMRNLTFLIVSVAKIIRISIISAVLLLLRI